jgi:hypothetical protein
VPGTSTSCNAWLLINVPGNNYSTTFLCSTSSAFLLLYKPLVLLVRSKCAGNSSDCREQMRIILSREETQEESRFNDHIDQGMADNDRGQTTFARDIGNSESNTEQKVSPCTIKMASGVVKTYR